MEFISYNFYLGTVNDGWQLNPCKFSLAAFFQWERKGGDDFQVLNMFTVGNRRSDHNGVFKNPIFY